MNYSTYRASLDIHASGSQAVLHAKQGDTKRRIFVTLTEDGKPYLIGSDCRAVFTAKKPDGNKIFNDCTIEGNIICYTFTAQTTVVAGRLDCEIRLYGADNALITSPSFDIIVDATVYNDGDVVESATEVSALTALVSETTTLISTVNTKLKNGEFNGPEGEAGGWYTPEIKQPIKSAMAVNFIPSKEGMPAVAPKLMVLPEGEPGGWYTPEVTQPDANTMRVSFTPSKEGMPAVDPADIAIPTGGGSGTSGEDGGYYTPSVDDEGNLTWTASKTDMPAVDGANIKGPQGPAGATGPKGDTGATGAGGKTAYAYAVEDGYTGTETEFAAKLAEEMPATLPNPNALTFTGAVTGSYDGSEALTVNIPSGGGRDSRLICDITLSEDAYSIEITSDLDGNSFELSEVWIFYEGSGTNTKNTYFSVSSAGNPPKRWFVNTEGTSQSDVRRKGCVHGVLMAPGIIRGDTVTINSNSGLYPNRAYNEPVSAYEDKITSLKLFTNDALSYAFVSGFRVRVYGR